MYSSENLSNAHGLDAGKKQVQCSINNPNKQDMK